MSGPLLTWSQSVRVVQAAENEWGQARVTRDDIARSIATNSLIDPTVPEYARQAFLQAQREERRAFRRYEDALAQRQEVADRRREIEARRARDRLAS